MSRMALSGTRTSSCRRCPPGFTNAWTVTSLGISCAAAKWANASRNVPTIERRKRRNALFPLSRIEYHSVARLGGRNMKRQSVIGATCAAVVAALIIVSSDLQKRGSVEAATPQAPRFEVDPMWPKPLPNHWIMGAVIGVGVDAKDNVWVIHREDTLEAKEKYLLMNPPAAECCAPAPPVLQFNQAGDLVAHWGGPGQGFEWPASNHGIDVDHKGNV